MAIKDQIIEAEAPETDDTLNDSEEKDLSIMVNLAKNLIDDEGINIIKQAEKSKDQGQVVGQFLFQLGSQLAEKLSGQVEISPRILLAEGGWVEQVSDYLQEEYGVAKNVMDRAEMYIGGMAQQMANNQKGGQPQPGAEQAQPAMPQGVM